MKVIVAGQMIDLGEIQTEPTISIIDYSRRVTDDFGVTTVVPRGFAHRMSVRLAVPFDQASALQNQLAAIRATPAMWIGDEDFGSLSFEGFYKEFAIDIGTPPLSFCTLTVEGLAGTDAGTDPGGDPAADGAASTLLLLQPATITDAVLAASSVPEDDYPAWSAGETYAHGARVVRAHRRWESLTVANTGNEPTASNPNWTDIGPTNRWAMFDEALGTVTAAAGNIVITLDPADAVNAVALLDVAAPLVRVQASGYDRSRAPVGGSGTVTFLDLPSTADPITITIAAANGASVGTLLMGRMVGLGVTEASPSAEITDYSRKEPDEFGEVTVVERAWSKRMGVKALLRSTAVDMVVTRLASVRARPCLWIGAEDIDALNVYGFFKDFTVTIGENVSTLDLTIEGLSKAAPVVPLSIPTLVTVYRNATAAPLTPGFDTGEVPFGWTLFPQATPEGQYRWSTQADFQAGKQLSAWTIPAKVGGTSWSDVVDDNPAKPKPEDGATVGATPEEKAKLAQLQDAYTQTAAAAAAAAALAQQIQDSVTVDITALTDQITGLGGSVDLVEATVGAQGALITTIQQTVSNQAGTLASTTQKAETANALSIANQTAITTANESIGQLSVRVGSAESDLAIKATAISNLQGSQASLSSTVSTQGAAITSLQTATSTLAGDAATLRTQVQAGGGFNLIKNGAFENGLAGWDAQGQPWGYVQGSTNGNYAYRGGLGPSSADVWIDTPRYNVDAGGQYTASFDFDVWAANGDSFYVRCELLWFGSNGTEITRAYGQNVSGNGSRGFWYGNGNQQNRKDVATTATAPSGALQGLLRCVAGSGQLGGFAIRQVKVEKGLYATPYSSEASVTQSFQTLSTLDTQYASLSSAVGVLGASVSQNAQAISNLNGQYASLSSTVSAQGASVTQNAQAISTLNGNVATLFAQWVLDVQVGGIVGGIKLANNGSATSLKFRSDLTEFTGSTSTARAEFRGGTWFGYDDTGRKRYQIGNMALS